MDLAATEDAETIGQFLSRWSMKIGSDTAKLAETMEMDPNAPAGDLSADDRKSAAAVAVAFAALTPQFLLR